MMFEVQNDDIGVAKFENVHQVIEYLRNQIDFDFKEWCDVDTKSDLVATIKGKESLIKDVSMMIPGDEIVLWGFQTLIRKV